MTEDEKRQQKAMLLLEYQEAETSLAHLAEKAMRMANQISQVKDWLRSKTPEVARNMGYRAQDAEAEFNKIKDSLRLAMNFDSVCALAAELVQARDHLEELRKRKEALGLK